MNRHDRRTSDSLVKRTGQVSPSLLQTQLVRVEQERQALQDLLYALVLAQGRVRVRKADIAALDQRCRLDVREVGDEFYLSLERGNMVVAGGVQDGKANDSDGAA